MRMREEGGGKNGGKGGLERCLALGRCRHCDGTRRVTDQGTGEPIAVSFTRPLGFIDAANETYLPNRNR